MLWIEAFNRLLIPTRSASYVTQDIIAPRKEHTKLLNLPEVRKRIAVKIEDKNFLRCRCPTSCLTSSFFPSHWLDTERTEASKIKATTNEKRGEVFLHWVLPGRVPMEQWVSPVPAMFVVDRLFLLFKSRERALVFSSLSFSTMVFSHFRCCLSLSLSLSFIPLFYSLSLLSFRARATAETTHMIRSEWGMK